MKTLLALLLALPLSTIAAESSKAPKDPVTFKHNKDGTTTATISKEATKVCESEGGCAIITHKGYQDAQQSAVQEVLQDLMSDPDQLCRGYKGKEI